MSEPILTITLNSMNYIEAEKALKITTNQFEQAMRNENELAQSILIARQYLGYSMAPWAKLSDFKPGTSYPT